VSFQITVLQNQPVVLVADLQNALNVNSSEIHRGRSEHLGNFLQADQLKLLNENFAVGELTGAGGYRLSDRAYAQLLDKLQGHYADMPPELRLEILAFYGDLSAPISTKSDSGEWAKVIKELDELKAVDVGVATTRQQ
jgi:hypothetical protein